MKFQRWFRDWHDWAFVGMAIYLSVYLLALPSRAVSAWKPGRRGLWVVLGKG